MDIGKYKQAMSYLLNPNSTLKTFALNPDAKLSDNDPIGYADGGRVGFKFGNLVTQTNKQLEKEKNPQKKYQLKKRLEFLKETEDRSKKIKGSEFIENLILKKDLLGRPFFSNYLEKLNALEDLQNNQYLNPKTNKPFTPQEWLNASPSYRSKFRDPETFLEKKKEYQKEYMRQRKENDPEYKQEFLKKKKEEYYSKERANIDVEKEIEPGKGVLREQRNKLLSYMSEAAKDNPNYQDIIKNGRFVGVADKENGINYYEAGYKGKLGKNSKLITEHPDFENVNNLSKLADTFKRELPNKTIASYFSSYQRVPTMSELYSFLQADPEFVNKMSPNYFKKNPLELHHQISMTDSPSQKIQLLLRDRNNQAGLKMIEYQKGNITKEELNKELKKLNTRYFVDGEPLGAMETSPETQLRTAKSQTTKLFNQKLRENPKLIEQITERLDIKSIELLNKLGCGEKYADGGRVKFGKGTNCYIKGLEKLQSEEPLAAKDVNVVKNFLQESGASTSEIRNLTNLAKESGKNLLQGFDELMVFGKGPLGRLLGYGIGVGLPVAFAGEEVLKGNYKQALRELADIPTLGLGLPESWIGSYKTDLINHAKEKGLDANAVEKFINKNEISKKINDAEELLKMGSTSEKFIKSVEDKKQSLYNEYDDLQLSPSDIENFKNTYKSFTKENYEKTLLSKDIIGQKTEEELNTYLKTLDPDFIQENKINIFPNKIEPYMENLPDYYKLSAADGGRVKLKDGTDDPNEKPFIPIDPLSDDTKPKNIMDTKLTRREVLGGLGVAAGVPIIAKLIKEGKAVKAARVAKVATKVLPNVHGMPEWFPSLVAKIEKEGKFPFSDYATTDNVKIKELSIPSRTGKGPNETYIMTKYPNGKIEIHADIKGGAYDQPFELHYTPPESFVDETTGKVIKEPGDFSIVEQRPRVTGGPHDADWELDWDTVSKDQALSDIEKVEQIVTGKITDPKAAKARAAQRDYYYNSPYEDIVDRYGDVGLHYDDIAKE